MKILFIIPAPIDISPGQRFRFEHYLKYLAEKNITYRLSSFFSIKGWKTLFSNGKVIQKGLTIIWGLIKRFFLLFTLFKYDYIYLYREAAPVGPPIFEWIMVKLLRKKVIYDFDDAIWISLSSAANPIAAKVKCTWKVKYICKWSYIVTVGNAFLANYAKQYCNDVRIIPTVVNVADSHNRIKDQRQMPITIGWTGTFTNFMHLPLVIPAIKALQKKYDLVFLIIADKDPALKDIDHQFIPWNLATEVDDLLKMNIGIMPLMKSDVQMGKCAFKAIQYMALGIPAVVTPISANCKVVTDHVDGYWADNDTEWYDKLEKLILDEHLRTQLGIKANKKIVDEYSVTATVNSFTNLFAPKTTQQ